jgi:hypothetical protein
MRRFFGLGLVFLLAGCGANQTHPARAPYPAASPTPLACVPNLDGRIDSSEMEAVLGVPATFLVSPPSTERAVDLSGAATAGDLRVWDWSADPTHDPIFQLTGEPLADKWYAGSFPNGQFAAAIDAAGTVEGIYSKDATALWLLGVASSEESPPQGKTLLPYVSPIALYRFPIQPGATWTSIGTVQNGTFDGIPYAGTDRYDVRVGSAGTLMLPDLTFTQAIQVRTQVTVIPAFGAASSRRIASWMFECFGEVARATSRLDEPQDDFTTATEVRRLGLPNEGP